MALGELKIKKILPGFLLALFVSKEGLPYGRGFGDNCTGLHILGVNNNRLVSKPNCLRMYVFLHNMRNWAVCYEILGNKAKKTTLRQLSVRQRSQIFPCH